MGPNAPRGTCQDTEQIELGTTGAGYLAVIAVCKRDPPDTPIRKFRELNIRMCLVAGSERIESGFHQRATIEPSSNCQATLITLG